MRSSEAARTSGWLLSGSGAADLRVRATARAARHWLPPNSKPRAATAPASASTPLPATPHPLPLAGPLYMRPRVYIH